MIYSKTCEYAIRALSFIASREKTVPVGVLEVSQETGVPRAYVTKIFQCLIQARILDSKSGPKGGYFLRVKPSKLTLAELMTVLDDQPQSSLSKCIMGQKMCNDEDACTLHPIWAPACEQIKRTLSEKTIADVTGMKGKFDWSPKRRVMLSKRMQNIFGYKTWQ